MKFHSYKFCPFCRKVQIVLEEKKIPYQLVPVDVLSGEARKEEFLELNPFAKVPVLIDEDLVLFESNVICEYLEELYPQPPLLPAEASGRGRIRLMERIHDNELAPRLRLLSEEYFSKKPGERDDRFLAETFKQMSGEIRWFDRQLANRQFFGGDFFSLADVALVPAFLSLLPQLNVDLSPYEQLSGWVGRVRKRPSVRKTDPGSFRQIHDRSNPPLKKVRVALGR